MARTLIDDIDGLPGAAAGDQGGGPVFRLYFGNVYEFVSQWLRHMYRRNVDGGTFFWSARWWESPEACSRLSELWRTWEYERMDPTGMAIWWRDFCDPAMAVIMGQEGPLRPLFDHGRDRTRRDEPLACDEAPAGLFRDERLDGEYVLLDATGTVPAGAPRPVPA